MTQQTLFADAGATVASPLCHRLIKPCPKQGRAIVGPREDLGGCVNWTVQCVTCQRTRIMSERKAS